KSKLLDVYADVGELPKVLIERGYRYLFRPGSRGDHTVHEMDLRFSIAIQCVQLDRRAVDFNTRAGNKSAERRCDIFTWMLIERLQHKYALGQNSWQYHNHHLPAVAGIKQLSRSLGVLFMVLYQIANDQIGVDKPSFAHRMLSRSRAAFAVAARIW